VQATFTAVTALMDHLRAEGIQRLVLESTSVIRGSNKFLPSFSRSGLSRARP
jgi:hypothetical protein